MLNNCQQSYGLSLRIRACQYYRPSCTKTQKQNADAKLSIIMLLETVMAIFSCMLEALNTFQLISDGR